MEPSKYAFIINVGTAQCDPMRMYTTKEIQSTLPTSLIEHMHHSVCHIGVGVAGTRLSIAL